MDERRGQRTATLRQARRRRVDALAATQEGLVSRRQILRLGLTRAEIRANVQARRWQRVGRHVIAVHCGPLVQRAPLWVAVLSGGPRAQLDGASSLAAAGLKGFHVDAHRVSVPRGARTFRSEGVDVRQTRRWAAWDLVKVGVPRSRNEVAAVRGALWAKSDKQAALLLTMAVQQGIVPADRIGRELLRIKKAPRLSFLRLTPDEFFEQIERALSAAGCPTHGSVIRTGTD